MIHFFEGKVDIKINIFRNKEKLPTKASSNAVRDFVILANNQVAVIMENDPYIRILNLKDPTKDFILSSPLVVTCLCVLLNNYLVSGSDKGTVTVWNMNTRKCVMQFTESRKIIALIPVGNLFISAFQMSIKIYDLDEDIYSTIDTVYPVISMTVTSTGKIISGHPGSFKVWDLKTHIMEYERRTIDDVHYIFPIQNRILVGLIDLEQNRLMIWDVKTQSAIVSYTILHSQITDCVLFSGTKVLISFSNGDLAFFNYKVNTLGKSFTQNSGFVNCIGILSNNRVISGGRDHYLKVWS